ncbi:WLM domain-containing protein [Earliella scabrosa]|nr:WLM domain-containing protein [Earliella scabrosa]
MPDVFVQSFTHLKDRPRADHALQILQRVASLVKPIMRKHGWILPVLSEFFPDSPNLLGLNVNMGQKILVRLRPPHAPDTFYDEEDIVSTMLHELTHNVHAPHDEKFYKFLSGLEEEYEALRRSGYDGEGFHANGRRLGVNVSHDLPPHLARQKALEAAEKRRQTNMVLGRGGRLGGIARGNKSPRELAAEAAERRAHDEKACASGALAQREAEKAARESVWDDVIDLTGSDSESEPDPEILVIDEDSPSPMSFSPTSSGARSPMSGYGSLSALQPGSGFTSSSSSVSNLSATSSSSRMPRPTVRRVERGAGDGKPSLPKPRSLSRPPSRMHPKSPATPPPTRASSIIVARHGAKAAIPAEAQWACPRCTLVNDALALQCAACLGLRPAARALADERKVSMAIDVASASDAGVWTCHVCGESGMPHDFWSCRYCGSIKAAS